MAKTTSNSTLDRMKTLMGYGLQNESANAPYSVVEYQKVAADNKVYGIVREGTKFYIKTAPLKDKVLKEDFNYIGGFKNRKANEYDSYASAQKNFDLKMMSIKESTNNRDFKVESWDMDKKETVVVEATEKMKKEILRERQIMQNVLNINESKEQAICCEPSDGCPGNNIKKEQHKTGNAKKAAGYDNAKLPKEMNEEENLAWNDDEDYMDKSNGTEIGDGKPFGDGEKDALDNLVEENESAIENDDDQNKPSVGSGKGPSDHTNKPFDAEKGRQLDEADEVDGEDVLGDDDGEFDGEDFGDEEGDGEVGLGDDEIGDGEVDDFDYEDDFGGDDDDDIYEDDLESRVEAMEDILYKIASKLGVDDTGVDEEAYSDDELFVDGNEEDEFESDEDEEEEFPMESRKAYKVFESKGYRRAIRRLNEEEESYAEGGMEDFSNEGRVPEGNEPKEQVFGKHPAYQKKVMTTPSNNFDEYDGYYDMNDDSVKNDAPYGEKIGDGKPFKIKPEAIDNAIQEAFRVLKKKI